jgi:hypothetical protein
VPPLLAALARSILVDGHRGKTLAFSRTHVSPTLILSFVTGLLRFTGTVKRDPAIAAWFAAQPEELQALAQPWFIRMRRCGPDVRELVHDGLATACVRDVPFAYVGIFSAHVNVGFFHGVDLLDQAGLLQGSGRRMRHVKLRPDDRVDESALEALIAAAYDDVRMRLMAAN